MDKHVKIIFYIGTLCIMLGNVICNSAKSLLKYLYFIRLAFYLQPVFLFFNLF